MMYVSMRDELEKIALSPGLGAAVGGVGGAALGALKADPGQRLRGAVRGGGVGALAGGAGAAAWKKLPQGAKDTANAATAFM